MPQSIEYQKVMMEIVYINLPGPQEPEAAMNGGELLHGFLAEIYNAKDPNTKKIRVRPVFEVERTLPPE